MVKKCKWITGFVVMLVAVLAVGVFSAPQASAATAYGSANLPSGVQAQIDAAAQMRANAASFITAGTCPLCNTAVTWDKATGNITAYSGAVVHKYIEGDLTLNSNGWPIDLGGTGTKLHIILKDANVKLLGSIWVGDANAKNVEMAILGNGTITSDGSKGSSASPKGNGLFWMRGESPKLILAGGTYTYTYGAQNNETALINTYGAKGSAVVDIYDGTVIGPETMSTTVDAYNVHLTNTTMNMYGGTIRNGTRIVSGWDGAANVSIKANSTLNMYGGTIENSYSDLSGSNIRLNTATSKMNMYGGTVRGGQYAIAGLYGANVYLYDTNAQFNMQGGKITGGEALFGGNICSLGGNITIGGTALIENGSAVCKTDSTGAVVSGGSAYGGNIYANSDAVLTITGGKITGGKVTGGPASVTTGVYTDYGCGGNIATTAATINISGGVIEGGSSPNGGSMYIAGSNSSLTVSGGTISGGRAKWGGGIYMANGKLTVSGGTITGASAAFRGGNVYIENATTTNITGGTISKGTVDKATSSVDRTGGNIYMAGTGTLTISGGTITGGEAMEGGNLCATKGVVTITDVAKIKDGLSSFRGGNVYMRGTAEVTVSGGRLSNGKAADGGNVFVEAGSFTVSGGVITGGQAYYDNNPQYSGDTVAVFGSQYKGGNIYAMTDIAITGGTISDGESLTSWGGNIFVKECQLSVSGGVITGGKALNGSDGRGGNIAAWAAQINVSGSAAIQNGKAAEGGNIYIEVDGSQLNVSGGTITGGKAIAGGNAYLASEMIAKVTGGEIFGGTAELGGNIYVGYQGKLQQTAGTISNGVAQKVASTGGDIEFDDLVNNPGGADINPEGVYAGADVYLYNADYIMQGGVINAVEEQETASVYADNGRVYLMATATVNKGKIAIAGEGKLFADNGWSGAASVVFPKVYISGNEIDTKWAEHGEVTVLEDLTVTFAPGGTFEAGMLLHDVEPFDAIIAAGTSGKLCLGKAEYVAMIGKNTYKTFAQALYAAQDGDTIVLYADCSLDDDMYLKKGRTLDLNGCKLTISGEVTAANKTTHIVDSRNGAGILAVGKLQVALNRNNVALPVWVEGEGFHFASHEITLKHRTAETHPDKVTSDTAVQFLFWLDGTADSFLAQQLADGGADNDVKVKIKIAWTNKKGIACEQFFTFPEANIVDYTAPEIWEKGALTLTVNNAKNVQDLKFVAMLVYDDSVQYASAAYSIN